jgi:hypothetical protein
VSETVAPKLPRFRYLGDRLFLAVVALYLLNRFAIKPNTDPSSFFHRWLNDLVCVPFWLPLILATVRKIGLRDHDGPPTWAEIIQLVVAWSFVFELLVPGTRWLHSAFPHAVRDPVDVLFYVVGGLAAGLIWRSGSTPPLPTEPDRRDLPQHCRWALGIAITTLVGTLAVLVPDQWRTQNHLALTRVYLEGLADRIEAMRKAEGRLSATLHDVSTWDARKVEYIAEEPSFVLIDLGTDLARGGDRDAADVWWPASRQPAEPWYAFALTQDTEAAFETGSYAGLFLAAVWLFWRGMGTPHFQHMTRQHRVRLVGRCAVLIGFTLGVLVLQNGFIEAATYSGH